MTPFSDIIKSSKTQKSQKRKCHCMNSIITVLIAYNQILLAQIYQLLVFIEKNIPLSSSKYDITSAKYKKLTVDKLPIIKTFEKLDYKQLLSEYKASHHGKDLKPIKSRGKNPVSQDTVSPCCGAPHIYLYDNTGGRGQICCKVCDQLSTTSTYSSIFQLFYLHQYQ